MKNNLVKMIARTFVLAVFTMIASSAILAQANKGGGRLVGTWDAEVTIRNCVTGGFITEFPSIASFNQGGTSIGSTAGMPQAARTPEHGIWRHVAGNSYIFKFKTFSFDPSGVARGYSIVTHTIELDQTGDTYTSAGTVQHYLMDGTPSGHGCSDAVGTRMVF